MAQKIYGVFPERLIIKETKISYQTRKLLFIGLQAWI